MEPGIPLRQPASGKGPASLAVWMTAGITLFVLLVSGNVLRNAVQAMPSGGRVTVRVQDEDTRLAVIVQDEGQGFSASALARLGEPFDAEKEGGMGLGLAVAKEICLAHGGGLAVENLAAGGTMVRVEFSNNPPGHSSCSIGHL